MVGHIKKIWNGEVEFWKVFWLCAIGHIVLGLVWLIYLIYMSNNPEFKTTVLNTVPLHIWLLGYSPLSFVVLMKSKANSFFQVIAKLSFLLSAFCGAVIGCFWLYVIAYNIIF